MEDKELQELFDAKRTAEANHRRQERLAAAIGAGKQKRTLWPVWLGTIAAAAAAALILMVRPTEQSAPSPAPILVAHSIVPVTTEEATTSAPHPRPITPTSHVSPINPLPIIDTIIPIPEPIAYVDTVALIDSTPTARPTVHRRRATRMIHQEAPRRENLLQMLAERISIDTSDSPQIKCINIKTSTI